MTMALTPLIRLAVRATFSHKGRRDQRKPLISLSMFLTEPASKLATG